MRQAAFAHAQDSPCPLTRENPEKCFSSLLRARYHAALRKSKPKN